MNALLGGHGKLGSYLVTMGGMGQKINQGL